MSRVTKLQKHYRRLYNAKKDRQSRHWAKSRRGRYPERHLLAVLSRYAVGQEIADLRAANIAAVCSAFALPSGQPVLVIGDSHATDLIRDQLDKRR